MKGTRTVPGSGGDPAAEKSPCARRRVAGLHGGGELVPAGAEPVDHLGGAVAAAGEQRQGDVLQADVPLVAGERAAQRPSTHADGPE
jgi:hypothetical protein